MNFREIISITHLRKFDSMCLHNTKLHQDKELQHLILSWAAEMLTEAREDWGKLHAITIDSVIKTHYKEKARRGAVVRDKKYAEFREAFAKIQKERYERALQNGNKLTANSFVEWFMVNKTDIKIPYVEQNKKNKLKQLAQANNRNFKKLLLG